MLFDGNGDTDESPRLQRAEVEALFHSALMAWDEKKVEIGDTVPVEWFYDVLGVLHPRMANSFEKAEFLRKNFMMLFHGPDGFRAHVLAERKRYLKTNYAGGYEVLKPEEQTEFAQKQRRKEINKALRDENFLLVNLDLNEVSSKKRQDNADAIAHNEALAKMLHRKRPGFESKKKK